VTAVVLVTGTGRSGSTLLGNLLGEVPGWFGAGEVRYLWQRGLVEERRCGCGNPVPACPVWSAVVDRVRARHPGLDAGDVHRRLTAVTRLRQLPRAVATPAGHRRALGDLPELLGDVYAAVADVTGATTVVDTSKLPLYGTVLAASDAVDLHVVHLVRSPQAAAHSWLRTKPLDDGGAQSVMEQRGAGKSALLWSAWNAATARLFGDGRYLRLRYEDVIADPRAALEAVLALRGASDPLAFLDGDTASLSVNHNVAGNPDRLTAGAVRLRTDERWVGELRERDKRVVRALTGPLAARYGYGPDGRPRPA
jgi:hypothetical protein